MDNYGVALYIVALVAIFYFMIWRPQQQRQKKHKDLMSSLQEGDNVTTIGGIVGTIVRVKDKTLIMKVAEGVKIEVIKTAIAYKNEEE